MYEDSDSFDGGCDGAFGGAGGGGSDACRIHRTVQGWNIYDCRQQTGGLPRTPGREGVVCRGSASSGEGSGRDPSACGSTGSYGSANCDISEGGNSNSGSRGGSYAQGVAFGKGLGYASGSRRRSWAGVGEYGQQCLSLLRDDVLRQDEAGGVYVGGRCEGKRRSSGSRQALR